MATIPELPLFTSGPLKSGTLNRLRDVVAFWQNPPAANIRASSSQNITSGGAYQIVTFHTTEYDTDTIVTSTTRLTAKTAGRYRIACTATFSANGTGDRYIVIRKNAAGSPTGGTQVISATAKPSSGSSCTVSTNSALEVQLSVNDTIEAFAFQDSGSTLTLNSGPGDTFLTMRLVSATATLSGEEATNIADALAESSLSTSDLDGVKAPGNYVQATAANATLARHYPVATVTGHLQVTSDGLGSPALVSQRWVSSSTNDVYVRTFSGAAWAAWELVGGGGSTDPEVVRDTMATALVAGSNVTITPNDGADTITIAATGGGSTVVAAVERSSDLAITAGTVTEIPWNAEITDTSGFHDLTTNTGRLTVPTGQGGTYEMQAHITLKSDSGNARRMLALGKNGTVVVESGIKGWGDATAFPSIDMVYTLTLAAADYLTLSVWSETAGTNLYGGRCTWSLRKVA